MTARIPVSFACGPYDRMDALRTGEVKPAGIDLNFITINHSRDLFDRSMGGREFDASEMSASEFVRSYTRGQRHFVGIPVFPLRVFRHGDIVVDSRQVESPKDLEGKKVGVQVYGMSAAVWIRGILAQAGVDLSTIGWVEGAFEGPGSHGKPAALPPYKAMKVSRNEDPDRGLSQLLADGDIAATIGAHPPQCLGQAPHVARLYPEFKEEEMNYYRTHGIFPIMHLVVVRRSLAEAHPWLASSLFNAFIESKDLALHRMKDLVTRRYMLPWLSSALQEIEDVFKDTNGDPFPYGLEANRKTLETFITFLYDQGLTETKPALEDLFWPVKAHQWR